MLVEVVQLSLAGNPGCNYDRDVVWSLRQEKSHVDRRGGV